MRQEVRVFLTKKLNFAVGGKFFSDEVHKRRRNQAHITVVGNGKSNAYLVVADIVIVPFLYTEFTVAYSFAVVPSYFGNGITGFDEVAVLSSKFPSDKIC